jgi:hypothetical protein
VIRIQFELSDEKARELDALVADAGVATRKDLLNNALSLFQWVVEERKVGRQIASLDESKKSFKELDMPWMGRFDA